jgi:acyl carrier protein
MMILSDAESRVRTRVIVGAMAPQQGDPLAADTRLVYDLGYDSLRLIELAMVLEEEFAIDAVGTEMASDLSGIEASITVGQVEAFVLAMRAATNGSRE